MLLQLMLTMLHLPFSHSFTFLVEEVRKNKQGPPFAGKRRINKSHFYCSGKKDTVFSNCCFTVFSVWCQHWNNACSLGARCKGLWKVNQCRARSLERTGPLCVSLRFQGSPQHLGFRSLMGWGLKSQVCVYLMERVGQDFSLFLEALMSCVQKLLEDTLRHILPQ